MLLYKERVHLDDFEVDGPTLNAYINKRLLEKYVHFEEYDRFATQLFNLSYYICTIVKADSHPERRFGAYYMRIYANLKYHNEYTGVVFAMVLLQMVTHGWTDDDKIKTLANTIIKELRNEQYGDAYFFFTNGIEFVNNNKVSVQPDSEFLPRKITRSLLEEIGATHLAQFYDNNDDSILEFVFAIGKTEEEMLMLTDFIHAAAKDHTHDAIFNTVESCILTRFHDTEEKAQIKKMRADARANSQQIGANQELQLTTEQKELENLKNINNNLHIRLKELEEENKQLKEQLTQKDDPLQRSSSERQIIDLQSDISFLNERIKDYQEPYKCLPAREAAIFALAICEELKQIPGDRQKLWPFMNTVWGFSKTTSEKRLREGITQFEADDVAKKFETTPLIARLIRELPEKLQKKKQDDLLAKNPKKKN